MSERAPRKTSLRQATNAVFGLYLVVHSITLAATAWGVPTFIRVASAVNPTRAAALGMLAFLLLLIDCALSSKPQPEGERATLAQNATGWIALLWLGGQLWRGVYAITTLGVPSDFLYTPLMAQLSSTGVFGVPWVALSQAIALPSAAFFLVSRVTTTFTPTARKTSLGLGVLALLFPLNGLVYVATGTRAFGPSHLTAEAPPSPCGAAR